MQTLQVVLSLQLVYVLGNYPSLGSIRSELCHCCIGPTHGSDQTPVLCDLIVFVILQPVLQNVFNMCM